MTRILVNYSGNVDDAWRDISRFLESCEPIMKAGVGQEWTLDLQSCRYLGPDAAVLIVAMADRGAAMGQRPQVLLPEHPRELDAFCDFVGLKHRFLGSSRPTSNHPKSETVEVSQYYEATSVAERRVVELIGRHFPLSEEVEAALGMAVNEVVGNVAYHAASQIGALLAARYLRNRKEVRVSVVDTGLGIPATLSKTHSAAADPKRALSLVLQGRHSARSNPGNRGLGISNLAGWVKRYGGKLILLSDRAVALLEADHPEPRIEALPWRWPGTAVFFTLGVEEPDD